MAAHLLHGVTVPLTTIMREPGVPSFSDSEVQLQALADAGADNLMLFGSNGEGSLILAERWGEYPALVVRRWRALRPEGAVVINVSAFGTDEMVSRARLAAKGEPDALVVSPPGYFRHTPDEILTHLRAVEVVGLPYVVYNLPKVSNPLTAQVYRSLIERPLIRGVKDSSADLETLRSLLSESVSQPHTAVAQGDELRALEALELGAAGIVPGIANIAPRLAVELFAASRRGDRASAENAQRRMAALTAIHAVRPGVPSIKAILEHRGIAASALARPLLPPTDEERAAVLGIVGEHEDALIGS